MLEHVWIIPALMALSFVLILAIGKRTPGKGHFIGIGFVAIAMGVFGFGEIIANLGKPAEHREVFTKHVKGLWPTRQDFKDAFPAVLRGTSLGSILGVLPGGGACPCAGAAHRPPAPASGGMQR